MKKNIFSVFQNNDTDDEAQAAKKVEPVKLTKKEARVEDQVKRQAYGDKVDKEVPNKAKYHNGPRVKDDYQSGEKRPYERHSGTGRPAFTNDYKKGGHGKGNVGGDKDIEGELAKDKKVDEEAKAEPVPEPVEEIMTLEEYVSKGGYDASYMKKTEESKPSAPVKITDNTVKVVAPKQKEDQSYSKKSKNADELVHTKGTNVTLDGPSPVPNGYRDRNARNTRDTARPKGGRVEFSDANFPALS